MCVSFPSFSCNRPHALHRTGPADSLVHLYQLTTHIPRSQKRRIRREEHARQEKLAFEKNWEQEKQKKSEIEARKEEERRSAFADSFVPERKYEHTSYGLCSCVTLTVSLLLMFLFTI